MTATLPTQEQVDRIAAEFAPDVIRIRFRVGRDWTDDPAVYFLVLITDEAAQPPRLYEIAKKVRSMLYTKLDFGDPPHIPYVTFRSESEQAQMQEKAWD